MLAVVKLLPPSAPPRCATLNSPIYFPFIFQYQPLRLQLNYSSLISGTNGFCLFAENKQKVSSFSKVELEKQDFGDGFVDNDDEYDDDELFDDDGDGDGDGDGDDVMLPFGEMDAWLKKKPKGFGEGKVYDTSLEDKLLEEIELSRKAQIDNLKKLKEEAATTKSKEELKKKMIAPDVVRVRISNLPKKKNIHRDLKSAFEGVCGIISILPVNSGNKKTRDPVCKGFAFVDFKSLDDANRFVEVFLGQKITFGTTEKHIKCEILKSQITNEENSVQNGRSSLADTRFTVSEEDGELVDDIGPNDPQSDLSEDYISDASDESDEGLDDELVTGNYKSLSASEEGDRDEDGTDSRVKPKRDTLSGKYEKKKANKKKPAVQKKLDSMPKLKIPQFAKSLQVPENAKLADVISSYDVRETLASKGDLNNKDFVRNFNLFRASQQSDIDDTESKMKLTHDSLSTETEAKKEKKKKSSVKKKPDEKPKLNIPHSSKRLKVQEKAKLADAFSRYGVREAVASKEV